MSGKKIVVSLGFVTSQFGVFVVICINKQAAAFCVEIFFFQVMSSFLNLNLLLLPLKDKKEEKLGES